jgi:hypothetical protein
MAAFVIPLLSVLLFVALLVMILSLTGIIGGSSSSSNVAPGNAVVYVSEFVEGTDEDGGVVRVANDLRSPDNGVIKKDSELLVRIVLGLPNSATTSIYTITTLTVKMQDFSYVTSSPFDESVAGFTLIYDQINDSFAMSLKLNFQPSLVIEMNSPVSADYFTLDSTIATVTTAEEFTATVITGGADVYFE